jgi:hypothetical protein
MTAEQNKKSEDRIQNSDKKENERHLPEDSHSPKPATPDMETHAHHLHKAPGKKWSHYLFEFLMLFLAVFAGFLAENWREHVVEHQRAKQYAKTLLKDLESDTTELFDVIKEDNIVLSCFDSIGATIRKGIKDNSVPGSFYYYCNIGTFSPRVKWNYTTITQITQSGSLRYFNDPELVQKLSAYYSNINFIIYLNDRDAAYRDESIKLRGRILNSYFYSKYSNYLIMDFSKIPDSLMNPPLALQTNDPSLLNEFANSFEVRRRTLHLVLTRDYPEALKLAGQLIELLKKEYHLNE